jgi:hypothetical protein
VDELPTYRPVSALAVLAAVAGVCSAAALAAPVLWMLPLVAVGLSLAALADVARPPTGKAGRWAALLGLALALGFGAQATVTAAATHWLMNRRAEAAATYWLDAICAGRLADARSMASLDGEDGGLRAAADVDVALGVCSSGNRTVRCLGVGERPESWRVQAATAAADLELVLSRRSDGRTERWYVSRCARLTPSTN